MTITATFSKGETFKYGGKREVKAAYCIRHKDSEKIVRKGFSLDRTRAENTAKGVFDSYNWIPSVIEIVDTEVLA